MPIRDRSSRAAVAPFDPTLPAFVQEVPQLVREKSKLLVQRFDIPVLQQRIALEDILLQGIGNAVVETAVERPEFIDPDEYFTFGSQFRDGLAQIAVVMDHLVDGIAVVG
jgi:hypothetical protein